MADRKKIIKLIEEEINVCESVGQCYRTIDLPALRDILSLLKEQEPIKPKSKSRHGSTTMYQHFCGNCMAMLHGKPKYCPNCGKAVKWND